MSSSSSSSTSSSNSSKQTTENKNNNTPPVPKPGKPPNEEHVVRKVRQTLKLSNIVLVNIILKLHLSTDIIWNDDIAEEP